MHLYGLRCESRYLLQRHGLVIIQADIRYYLRIDAFLLGRGVGALVLLLQGAVVQSILVWLLIVQRVVAGLDLIEDFILGVA